MSRKAATTTTSYMLQLKCLDEMKDRRQDEETGESTKPEVHIPNRAHPPTRRLLLLIQAFAVAVVVVVYLAATTCHALIQVPNRHTVASMPGDLVLGILVPVHERPSPKQAQTRTCGAVREQYGIQRVEAAFRTIDSINADPSILPNITLGLEIRDSCWHSPIALEQSIEFIRDAMAASEQSQVNINPSLYQQKTLLQQQIQAAAAGASASASAAAAAAASAPDASTRSLRVNQLQHQQLQQQQQQQLQALNELQQNISSQAHVCAPYLKQQLQLQQSAKKIKNLVGVVGPASSGDTVQVQNLLQLFNMPQVGYSATSRDLSNKNFFKYFLRVVPSDKLQARVLIDLMLAYNWTYITVVYTEGSYGSSLMNAFRERADKVGICPATLESMPPNADDGKFDELIGAIQAHPNARVVICMCEGRTIGRLFAALQRHNVSNEYLIVGSDGWSDRFDVVDQQEEVALGGISIRIHSAYVHDFDDYYFALNPFNNHRNPWFAEFWEQRFQCNLQDFSASQQQQQPAQQQQQQRPAFIRPPNAKVYNRTCTGKESLRQNHKQDAKMAFVQKSIITMALGLDSMQRTLCGPNRVGLCPEMLPVNGSIFLQHLMNVSFSFLDEEVYFDEQGDPPGKYEILNFQRKPRQAGGGGGGGGLPSSVIASNEMQAGEEPPPLSYDSDSYTTSVGGQDQFNRAKVKQKQPPLPKSYNSYSTLKVNRADSSQQLDAALLSAGADSTVAADQLEQPRGRGRRRRRRRRRRTQRQTPVAQIPPIDYNSNARSHAESSPTSNYEYVHVGSWKSSDGLSMFGDIHWPSRSSIFHLSLPKLSGAPASTNTAGAGDGLGGGFYGTTNGSSYNGSGAELTGDDQLDSTTYRPISPHSRAPTPQSICSLPCAKGHAKKIQSDSVKCCWVCVPCRPHEYLFNEFKCQACEKGSWPNQDQTDCDQIPIESFDWRSLEALACIGLALFGLVLTLAIGAVFIKHNNTPVVKSTTRELSYMILFAMLLAYTNTFFLVAKPSQTTCFVTRILPGFSFAMLYGALVTKTNRIARILAGSKKKIITRRPYFMSATAQVTITWLIVLIECAIIVAMLWREPADSTHEYPSDERVVLVCNTTTMGIMAPLGFDFFLIAMCTLYAFKTRNVPENFNEAKFIGFTMYTTLVIWIAFVVIYLSSDHKVTTLSLCISFSALFALFLLFFPRCYIIIFKPEKNNRSFFTTIKNVRCHIGYQIGPGSGSTNSAHHLPAATTAGANSTMPYIIGDRYDTLEAAVTCGGGAGNSSEQFNQNGSCQDAPARATRSRTSGRHRIAPAANMETGELAGQKMGSLLEQRWLEDMMHFGSGGGGGGRDSASNSYKRAVGGSLAGDVAAAANQRRRTDSEAVQRIGSDATHTSDPAQGGANGGGPRASTANSLHYLMSQIWSAFARRSQRKESDKTAVIQQHLRAIRHAENLDRQTNFRRSQVQRLIQRFDSGSTAAWSQHQQQKQQNHLLSIERQQLQQLAHSLNSPLGATASTVCFSQQIREFIGELQSEKFGALVASDDAHQLLAAMSQLIGHDNLWRLASVLSGYCRQKSTDDEGEEDGGEQHTGGRGGTHPPLDLRRPADRRMAMAWLRFLIQMAQRALESVQLVISSTCVHSSQAAPGPSRHLKLGAACAMSPALGGGVGRARGLSLSAQQSRDLITMHEASTSNQSDHELPPSSLQGTGGDGPAVATTTATTTTATTMAVSQQQCESGLQLDASEMSAQDKGAERAAPSGSQRGQWQVSKVDECGGFEQRRARAGRNEHDESQMSQTLASCRRALVANCDDGRDPIERALERITGKVQGRPASSDINQELAAAAAKVKTGPGKRDQPSARDQAKLVQRAQHKHQHHKHSSHRHHAAPQGTRPSEPEDQDTRLAFGGDNEKAPKRDECLQAPPPLVINSIINNSQAAHWAEVANHEHVSMAATGPLGRGTQVTCTQTDETGSACCECPLASCSDQTTRRSRRPAGSATCCHAAVVGAAPSGAGGRKCHLTTARSGDNEHHGEPSCRRCCYCSPCDCCRPNSRRTRSPRPTSSPARAAGGANHRKQQQQQQQEEDPSGHAHDASQSARRARPRSMAASNQTTTTTGDDDETAPERHRRFVVSAGGTFHDNKRDAGQLDGR